MEQKESLNNLLPSGRYPWLVYLSCLLVFAGFSCSRAMISIGIIGLVITGFLASDIRSTVRVYMHSPVYYINALFFVVILLSGLNSNDRAQWLNFLRIKIPFLILPLAFCGFRFFDRIFFNKILLVFVACMLVSSIAVMGRYLLHYEEITGSILVGSTIPVPFSHIRYTLLLVFAFFTLLWLWSSGADLYYCWPLFFFW